MRAARRRRRRQWRRAWAIGALSAALGITIVLPPRPLLVWNASASAPVGLYAVRPARDLHRGDMVIAKAPEAWAIFAARRRYLPANVPLVKRVAAVRGDVVCALARAVFVNGRRVAERRPVDGQGRPMPWWRGCVRLSGSAHFLLMDDPDSFDGRYFGPTDHADVIGRARLLRTSRGERAGGG